MTQRPSDSARAARKTLRAHPDPPPGGLLWRITRRLIREVLWLFIITMNAGRRFGAMVLRTEYRLAGGCKKRGVCCEHVLMEWSDRLDASPWLKRLVLFKMTRIYSFFDRGYTWEIEDGLIARVLSCHALQPDGSCGEYRLRPLICRAYPEVPIVGKPLLHKGCGFRFERRDGQAPAPNELIQIGGLPRE